MDTLLLAAPTLVVCISKTQPGLPSTGLVDCLCLLQAAAPAQTSLCPENNARHGCLPSCSQALARPATETLGLGALVTKASGNPSQPRMASQVQGLAAWAAVAQPWAAAALPWAAAVDFWVAPHARGREHLPW